MFSELLKRCLLGDRIASSQLFLQIALHHSLENLFKRMGLEPKLMIVPTPHPGPPSFEWGKSDQRKKLPAFPEGNPPQRSLLYLQGKCKGRPCKNSETNSKNHYGNWTGRFKNWNRSAPEKILKRQGQHFQQEHLRF